MLVRKKSRIGGSGKNNTLNCKRETCFRLIGIVSETNGFVNKKAYTGGITFSEYDY